MVDQSDKLTGSRDGQGAGDHDTPYRFGHRARVAAPWPFSELDLARLMVMHSHVLEARFGAADSTADDLEPALWTTRLPQ